jgi:folate-binding protein YgfZ
VSRKASAWRAYLVARGARFEDRGGREALCDLGDVVGEAHALAGGAGLLVRAGRAFLHVEGADRVDFLHRMLTQDVRGLAEGRAAYACLLTVRGRVLGDLLVWHLGDRLALDLDGGALGAVLPALERAVIADDVRFTDAGDDVARLALAGPRAPAVLEDLGAAVPTPGAHVPLPFGGPDARILRFDLGRRPAYEILAHAGAAPALLDLLAGHGARLVGEAAWDVARVEEGVPAFGREIDGAVLPLEVRLGDTALSWSKGCYPGQEPVVKARHRGRPPNLLVRLRFDTPAPPPAGAALALDGHAAGRVTTAVRAGGDGPPVGLGIVRTPLAGGGAVLEVAGGGTAVVEGWRGDA